MAHNSIKTYMRKGGFRTSGRPSLKRPKQSCLTVIHQRSATSLHYNCLPRDVNVLASWIVPNYSAAKDFYGGGAVLGWETEAYDGTRDDRLPLNDYPVACSIRMDGETWVFFKLEDAAKPQGLADLLGPATETVQEDVTRPDGKGG